MKTYRAVAERSGNWWAISVPELPGVFTQAKTLEKAETMAAEAIALMLDVDTSSVKAEIDVKVPDAEDALEDLATARRRRAEAEERVTAQLENTIKQLTEMMSVRDAGKLLGISYQRVSQLANAGTGSQTRRANKAAGAKKRATSKEKTSRHTHA